jgi:hypothetical protein
MAVLTEQKNIDDILVREFDPNYNRETITAAADIEAGQIIKAGGLPVAAASDTPIGVALATVKNGAKLIYDARGPVVLKDAGLGFFSAATDSEKNTLRGKLNTLGFVLR